jgi:hypothetical protein
VSTIFLYLCGFRVKNWEKMQKKLKITKSSGCAPRVDVQPLLEKSTATPKSIKEIKKTAKNNEFLLYNVFFYIIE